ncbi:hypothetical protein G9A89_010832 [Geosiphon pyriformis]|nr:hypothetical protein G9A89_010832 [Geosiphon pyriformis]
MSKSECARDFQIRLAIDKRIESFKLNKSHTIRSVLEHFFHKITLNYLVVNSELVLDSNLVKAKMDVIIEEWTRKHVMYVFNDAFFGVICLIDFNDMLSVISNLSNEKAVGLSKGVLTNTYPIALIKTACKILSKKFSDRIFSACSIFNVFREDNFSVLKGTIIQSSIFTIGSVIKNALEKDHELWLVLQNMQKTYDSVHDSLDQKEIFLPFFWHIFYDPLLYEVKRQTNVYGYKLNSHFIAKTDHSESQTGLTSFFAAGVFVDNTIWIGNSQITTQHILNIVSKFFWLNDISINNKKTVAIPINCRVYEIAFAKQLCNCAGAVFNWKTFKWWKRLNLHGPIPNWFGLSVCFLNSASFFPICSLFLVDINLLDILESHEFGIICDCLLGVNAGCLSVYTDGSLNSLEILDMKAGTAVFFENINLGLDVKVSGLVFSIMTELQVVALALECIFFSNLSALDACKLELGLLCLDFQNWCWIKNYLSVLGNKCVDTFTKTACFSNQYFFYYIAKCYIRAGGGIFFANSRYFVHNIFQSVGSSSQIVVDFLHANIDWFRSFLMWHPDSHLTSNFISRSTIGTCTYFIKALHYQYYS